MEMKVVENQNSPTRTASFFSQTTFQTEEKLVLQSLSSNVWKKDSIYQSAFIFVACILFEISQLLPLRDDEDEFGKLLHRASLIKIISFYIPTSPFRLLQIKNTAGKKLYQNQPFQIGERLKSLLFLKFFMAWIMYLKNDELAL